MASASEFVSVTLQTSPLAQPGVILQILDEELKQALYESLDYGKQELKREIVRTDAVASKQLLNSVVEKINSASTGSWIYSGDIKFSSPADEYAYYARNGRGPTGFTRTRGSGSGSSAFVSAIITWMAYRRIDPQYLWPIVKSIEMYGTKARHDFMSNTESRTNDFTKKSFEAAAARIKRRMENADNNASR